jgi:hypothetical protein
MGCFLLSSLVDVKINFCDERFTGLTFAIGCEAKVAISPRDLCVPRVPVVN